MNEKLLLLGGDINIVLALKENITKLGRKITLQLSSKIFKRKRVQQAT